MMRASVTALLVTLAGCGGIAVIDADDDDDATAAVGTSTGTSGYGGCNDVVLQAPGGIEVCERKDSCDLWGTLDGTPARVTCDGSECRLVWGDSECRCLDAMIDESSTCDADVRSCKSWRFATTETRDCAH